MRVWILHLAELLPGDQDYRPFRYSYLADALVKKGHEVVRWAPTFVHAHKALRANGDTHLSPSRNYAIELIHCGGYKSNVSIARVRFHARFARRFTARAANTTERPDIIVSGYPTQVVGRSARELADHWGIPLVVDLRDQWPDAQINLLPAPLRSVARLGARPHIEQVGRLLCQATALTAITEDMLRWGLQLSGRTPGPADRVYPIGYSPAALDESQVDDARRKWAERLEPDLPVAFFVGTVGRQFDFAPVLSAAHRLNRDRLSVQFVCAGGGDKLEAWSSQAAGVPGVHFPGWIGPPEIAAIAERATVGLAPYAPGFPSSLPNKFFEYAALGLPVLSSLPGALATLLAREECGRTYATAAELCDVLIEMAAEPSLASMMGARGRDLYESQFRAEAIYEKMAVDLEDLVLNRGGDKP